MARRGVAGRKAFPGGTFHGKVSRINPRVAKDSRTFEDEDVLLVNLDGHEARIFCCKPRVPALKEEKTNFSSEGRCGI